MNRGSLRTFRGQKNIGGTGRNASALPSRWLQVCLLVVALGTSVLMQACSVKAVVNDTDAADRVTADADATSVAPPPAPIYKPKNVILFIADGCGPASFTFARQFITHQTGRESLVLDSIQVGSVATHAANSLVTDSASSATAYATGHKTNNGMISVAPDGTPLTTILERSEQLGKATGLVATSRITHATPATFAAHRNSRNEEAEIAVEEVQSGVDLMLGGGSRFFVGEDEGGSRTDGVNVLDLARARGMKIVNNAQELSQLNSLPALGLFAEDHMAYEVDREQTEQPSLATMTNRAIDLLSTDEDGFFLMVEGSRIDHAAHGNDLSGHLHDILAYEQAVAEALRFAEQDGNTLVLAVSDHETGGLSVGRRIGDRSEYKWDPAFMAGVTASVGEMVNDHFENDKPMSDVLRESAGIADLSDSEIESMETAENARALSNIVAELISRRALIGWTTGGHTAVDVNMYAFGPGADLFEGHRDNTHIGRMLFQFFD